MSGNRRETAVIEQRAGELYRPRTTIGLKTATKNRLDKNMAPGQCYNGFICQLVDLWERIKEEKQDCVINLKRGG